MTDTTPQPIIGTFSHEEHLSTKKISLTAIWTMFAPHCYIVTSITNSTYYKPGDRLEEWVMKQVCAHPDWDVLLLSDNIIGQITGAIGAATAIRTVPGLI